MKCNIHDGSNKTLLKNSKLKATPKRLALLDLLEHSKGPVSIREIFKHLGKGLDMATLYRNIESLKELGVVAEVNISSGNAFYELSSKPHHHHLVCEACGKVSEIENCPSPKLSSMVLKNNGFKSLSRHSLEFFGICNKCAI